MTPSFCSTPYLHCIFHPRLYPDMSTEFLSRRLYIAAHHAIRIISMQLCGPIPHIQGPTSRLIGFTKRTLLDNGKFY
jgi:hypothetical protein